MACSMLALQARRTRRSDRRAHRAWRAPGTSQTHQKLRHASHRCERECGGIFLGFLLNKSPPSPNCSFFLLPIARRRPRTPFCAGTLARAKTQPPGISGQTWAHFDRGPYVQYHGATRGCVRAFSGAAWVKNTHFQKSGQFWRCLIPTRCRKSGPKMCGAHSLSHEPLCQRKPHVQTCSSPSPMQSGRFDPLLFPLCC